MRRILLTPSTKLRVFAAAALQRTSRYNNTTTSQNPVNVETFELDETIVKRHLDINKKWTDIGELVASSRQEKNYEAVLKHTADGFALLEEVGPMDSPIQCETNLLLESAQAYFNLSNPAKALESAGKARTLLAALPAATSDASKLAEVDEFIGHLQLQAGNPTKAEETFRAVLLWIDTDARKAMPMVSVAAVNQRRTVVMGIGMALEAQAAALEPKSPEAKALYGKALDTLIDSLNAHIEANDFGSVKSTLSAVLRCFLGVDDVEQAVSTCVKYVSWCKQHEDPEGVVQGEELLANICAEHKLANPLAKKE